MIKRRFITLLSVIMIAFAGAFVASPQDATADARYYSHWHDHNIYCGVGDFQSSNYCRDSEVLWCQWEGNTVWNFYYRHFYYRYYAYGEQYTSYMGGAYLRSGSSYCLD